MGRSSAIFLLQVADQHHLQAFQWRWYVFGLPVRQNVHKILSQGLPSTSDLLGGGGGKFNKAVNKISSALFL